MSTNDTIIKELLAKVEKQRAELGPKPRPTHQTNGVFKGYLTDSGNVEAFNINVVNDPVKLVEALAFVLHRHSAHEEAKHLLGVEDVEFTYSGFGKEDWVADFKGRIDSLNWDKKKKKLTETENKLKALVSEETKTKMELDEIQKSLGL